MAAIRQAKYEAVQKVAGERSRYLIAHPRADAAKARLKVEEKIRKLRVEKWLHARKNEMKSAGSC
ncbi:MAG: hypothetical protein ACLFPD_08645 [Desulfosudaceae bacterium]